MTLKRGIVRKTAQTHWSDIKCFILMSAENTFKSLLKEYKIIKINNRQIVSHKLSIPQEDIFELGL